MKKTAFIFLAIASLACGMQAQLPTNPSYIGEQSSSDASLPVNTAVLAEPTESVPLYVTTGALNVRSQPTASSEILGTLVPGSTIHIYIIDQLGDDCYRGEWYAIDYQDGRGYVCSLWVVKK
jgi:uncharacterized protein YgiM (DUF1202 family)